MRDEYDFTGGVRGKYFKLYHGCTWWFILMYYKLQKKLGCGYMRWLHRYQPSHGRYCIHCGKKSWFN